MVDKIVKDKKRFCKNKVLEEKNRTMKRKMWEEIVDKTITYLVTRTYCCCYLLVFNICNRRKVQRPH
jgi:predicted nucleic acid-binding Zn finger protein